MNLFQLILITKDRSHPMQHFRPFWNISLAFRIFLHQFAFVSTSFIPFTKSFCYRLGHSTVNKIIAETLQAIWTALFPFMWGDEKRRGLEKFSLVKLIRDVFVCSPNPKENQTFRTDQIRIFSVQIELLNVQTERQTIDSEVKSKIWMKWKWAFRCSPDIKDGLWLPSTLNKGEGKKIPLVTGSFS